MKTCIFLPKVTRGGIVGLQMDFLSFSFFFIPLNILVQIFVDSGGGEGVGGWGWGGLLLFCSLWVMC